MSLRFITFYFTVILFFSVSAISYAGSHSLVPTSADKHFIQTKMTEYGIVGTSIAYIHDKKIKWISGFGYSDKAKKIPVKANTKFQAASISKSFTAIAVLKTFSEKHLNLDANINNYLMSWRLPENEFTQSQAVTPRLILGHVSGITGFRYKGYARNTKQLPSLLQSLNGEAPANTPPVEVVREPKTKYEYSPAGYTVLQQMLVDLYQQPFDSIMQKTILNPLKMRDSSFVQPISDEVLGHYAKPYAADGTLITDGPHTFIASAAGGLWTTVNDLAKWMIALQNVLAGKTVAGITPDVMQQALQPSIDKNTGLGFVVGLGPSGQGEAKGHFFGHSGFQPGYLAIYVVSKTSGDGVVILTNTAPTNMDASDIKQYSFLTDVADYLLRDK